MGFSANKGFNANKLKPQLKMAVHRFQMSSNKKSALLKQNMREVAVLLAEDPPKEEKARIKAESLIRDDYMIEAYDILSLNCELISERIKLIEFSKECPPDLKSCISTLVYAAPRVDIPELAKIQKQLTSKFGMKFTENAMKNVDGVLNERVVIKLSVQPPAAILVQTYLEQICEKYEVQWSGMGPQAIAQTGMTINGDEDDHPNNGQSQSLPPPLVPDDDYNSVHNNKDDSNKPHFQTPNAPANSNDLVTPLVPLPAPDLNTTMNKNDDKDDNNNNKENKFPSSSGGNDSASYTDLAAKFENLKKL